MRNAAMLLLLAMVPAAAAAQERGIYLGVSLGSTASNACDEFRLGVNCRDGATNAKIFFGYQLGRNLAVEGGYVNTLVKTSSSSSPGDFFSSGAFSSDLTAHAWDLVLVPTASLGTRASIHGKVGLYRADARAHESRAGPPSGSSPFVRAGQPPTITNAESSNTGLTLGLGFGWSFGREVVARVDWQRYKGAGGGPLPELNVDMLHLGALYRF